LRVRLEPTFHVLHSGRLLALPTNIRLGWKSLPGTNPLAYSENLELTSVKRFITLATDEDITLKTLDFGKRVDKKLLRFGDKKFAKIFISYED